MGAPPKRQLNILMVDDDPDDVQMTREALADARLKNSMRVVPDGDEAMAYLRKEGKHADAPRPDLILLDLRLPKKNGYEVLAEIKSDADLKRIPVVVFSSSEAETDILKSYGLHANCYIAKPVGLDSMAQAVRSIENFWFGIVRLPPR